MKIEIERFVDAKKGLSPEGPFLWQRDMCIMRIGGLHKNSFIDFPGQVSCAIFFSGCNFHCPYCHNPELARGEQVLENAKAEILDFLQKRKGFLDGVVFSGGEPTLQAQALYMLANKARTLGYKIKLDTNGSHPEVLQTLLEEKLVDYVAMDIKTDIDAYAPHFTPDSAISKVLRKSIILLKTAKIPYEFRTTAMKPYVTPEIIDTIGAQVGKVSLYALQLPHHEKVLKPSVFKENNWMPAQDEVKAMQEKLSVFSKKVILR